MISGGMLKIDAVSLVETLEGYPYLFVITLFGVGYAPRRRRRRRRRATAPTGKARRRTGMVVIGIPRWGGGRTR